MEIWKIMRYSVKSQVKETNWNLDKSKFSAIVLKLKIETNLGIQNQDIEKEDKK